jgi:4'-phosphopantetheinyl transferase
MTLKQKIHPVILAVPDADRQLSGRDKVAALGRRARRALEHSAQFSGLALGALDKRENGAPIPSRGVHWSLTHKSEQVAAVCAPFAIGIDIEKIRPYKENLRQRIADAAEWALAPQISDPLFFRYWTAKEAVLKAVGKGIAGLSQCRIRAVVDNDHLKVVYGDLEWTVAHYWSTKDHIVTVTANLVDIEWHELN